MNRSSVFVGVILGMLCLAGSYSPADERVNDLGTNRDESSHVGVEARMPAFPDALGWGRNATGGRGGEVRKVTHLKDSGPGSLRAALQTEGAAYVVFEVSGTINLQSRIKITSNKTIAGETAFRSGGEGITLKINQGTTSNTLVVVSGGSNLICRYLRFRRGPGLPPEVDGDNLLLTGTGTDFIFDHCSFSWSTDELVNPYGPTRMTFQNCIFSEALYNSTHAYTTDTEHAAYPNPHSMGPLVGNGSDEVTFYNNLFAHNNQRNPLIGGGVGGGTKFELVNNLIYNFGSFGTVFSDNDTAVTVNFINNYHMAGPNTSTSRYAIAINKGVTAYARGNINSKRPSQSDPEWNAIGCESGCGTYMQEPAPTAWQSSMPFDFPLQHVASMSATAIRDGVIGGAGANLVKDAVDTRIFNDVLNGTGGFVSHPSEVGGWPQLTGMKSVPVDTDDDGMADRWEEQRFGSLASGPNDDQDGDGYTNLEEYLHQLAAGNGLNDAELQ
ncbi:hypothetical protein [Rhodopirellula sp. P2]|uniref:hypothetical protein n=1 Tax=Rhodopirellula sp. P2 TaxID=2127060 RepID=UPI002368C2D7|nr:hypothetical protein [Rhodopirellula sp. P2]WDQ16694.1 hypothetical protein PSR62_24210 [Rhodopirellula sp. P2]